MQWEFYTFDFAPVWAVHAIFAVYNFAKMTPPDDEFKAMLQSTSSSSSSSADGAAKETASADGDPSVESEPATSESTAATAPQVAACKEEEGGPTVA